MEIKSRLPDVGTTIFTTMSKMAAEHNAINLSQGFPDFPLDERLFALVTKYMNEGFNQYAPMPGTKMLRDSVANLVSATYGRTVDPETEVLITAGATQAIFSVIAAFISPGDEVILFDPSYDSYNPAVRLNGGVPVHINLKAPNFEIDWQLVEQKVTKRTKMIMINTPHNPLGTVLGEEDLLALERLALRHGLLVLSDEVYERLIYDGRVHQSVLRFPALASQSMACYSFGKTFHATGWKVGYIIGPATLMKEVRKTHQYIVFSVNTPAQMALGEYLKDPDNVNSLSDFYQKKRDYFLAAIKGSSLEPLPSCGSYFQLLSYRNISKKPDVEMAEELTRRHKVAAIPVSVFYRDGTDNHLLRFCFAKRDETLAAAAAILRSL